MAQIDNMIFENREDAAKKLLEVLPIEKLKEDNFLLVAVSTQGVSIAEIIAKELNLCYDLLFCEAIYSPTNKSCVIGMVSETEEIVLHEELVSSFEINLDFIYAEAHRRYEEKILPKVYKYRKGDLIGSLKGKNVLLIDEGAGTGLTIMTAIKTVISMEAKSVAYATPVLSKDVVRSLDPVVDELFYVQQIASFIRIDFYYEMLKELDPEAVLEIIGNSKYYLPFQKRGEK